MDGTDPHFFIALLKFVLWHSLGTGVLSRQKSMHLLPLYAWDELRVYGIDPIFALITLGHPMGFLRVYLALACLRQVISRMRGHRCHQK
jgi:hypothetical protein